MGIQVTYATTELSKIPAEKLRSEYFHTMYTGPQFTNEQWEETPEWCAQQEADPKNRHKVYIHSVDDIFIGYEMPGGYCYFDNKIVNMESREMLDKYGIEYTRG